jgi:hypothetical protein
MMSPAPRRCYLVYAVPPAEVSAREANELLNEYISERCRGIVVFHDHFTGAPHGGVAVFDVPDEGARELLDDPGPLAGWEVSVHGLTFSLAATGFAAQMELTAKEYAGRTMDELAAEEPDDARFWWRRRQ